ncbi:ABC transporter ATP-binding protein [Chondromyces crocatus]|uniref:ABC transporter n=1 Tax=Chondromyces crocatus TaxID=52 RepID=A0A0K1ED13_CHOCO|nr:ABC transporter ATP-binding protein [Chondromyces crocatus]AKT38765.1 ABC transporter [Chondromyces crocatus]
MARTTSPAPALDPDASEVATVSEALVEERSAASSASREPDGRASGAPEREERPTADVLIDVRDLAKTFKIGFIGRKQVHAVRGVSFEVRRREIFGFLGPNGAGKTTTIKMLTGLIAPTSGEAYLFGERVPSPEARRRIGFLPENPYVYPYLTPREFVSLCGRLSGMGGSKLQRRTMEVLEQVKIAYAADRQVRRLSKGMLQRTGLAAALVSDPEMLILDEPMSGLDPVGRKEVRDLIFSEREQGRTIFFSTHILSDVESMCDRVTILREGKVVVSGSIRQLLRGEVLRTDITLANASEPLVAMLEQTGAKVSRHADVVVIEVEGDVRVRETLESALKGGAQVVEVTPRRETLEDLFLRRAL